MLLRDVIEKEGLSEKTLRVEYRSVSPEGLDLFTGEAEYCRGELRSLDGDDYELDDEIVKYELSDDGTELKVWEELEWLD